MSTRANLFFASLFGFLIACGSDDDGPSGIDGPDPLSFFATSVGSGARGGDFGGLVGADDFCQMLGEDVGAGSREWRAYLSTAQEDARDRIGSGPWYNAAGEKVADDIEGLHRDGLSNDDPQHVLDENGDVVPRAEHDILTGSDPDGRYLDGATCQDWTSDGEGDIAQVGHSDIPPPPFPDSWNSAHTTLGCSQATIIPTAGSGRVYCFAIR
jgi:hypothetical protein